MSKDAPVGPRPLRSFGIVVNEQKPAALRLGEELQTWLQSRGVPSQLVCLGQEAGADEHWHTREGRPAPAPLFGDALIILGGDGTLLAASRLAAPAGLPMLSIHLGTFGFFAECEPEEAPDCIERLLQGDYRLDRRLMLQATIEGPAGPGRTFVALNDAVIAKGTLARLLHMHAYVNSDLIAAYSADGLIVSTPSGSTAYSLSAGGPLAHPDVDVLLLTPICSHGLNVRPLVMPASAHVTLTVENAEDSEAIVTMDGQTGVRLAPGEHLVVSQAPYRAHLISLGKTTFYRKLREKLGWGERC